MLDLKVTPCNDKRSVPRYERHPMRRTNVQQDKNKNFEYYVY